MGEFNVVYKTSEQMRAERKAWEQKQPPMRRFKRPAYQYTSLEIGGKK